MIVEMAPCTRRTQTIDIPETSKNAGEALQGRMLIAIENMMKEMA